MLFIHIGLQKTGTTSLQFLLEKSNILKFPLDKVRFVKSIQGSFKSSGNQKFFKKLNDRFFYGWIIVSIGSLGIFASGAGQSHTFSPFIPVISKDLKISSTSITTAYMIATLFAAFLLPKIGKLVDKYGPRLVLIFTTILLGIGCMIFGAATNFLMLAIAFGFLRFFGQGSLMLGSANIITQWFDKKRGFALGLMGLGFAISMGLHPPISDFLISNYGWRQAWVIIGFSTWILMLPPLIFLAINKPEDVNILPDGKKHDNLEKKQKTKIFGLTLNEALKEKSFYILSFSFFSSRRRHTRCLRVSWARRCV